jgi:hypothetical protein
LLLYLALGILSFFVWLALLIHHLLATQRNQLWTISFLVGQAFMAWAFFKGFSAPVWILLGAVIIAQLPFALQSPDVKLGIPRSDGSGESTA